MGLDVAASRKPIRALPPLLVNQIAAGEVVDRPSSVIKELVENSLDAGSSRIVVEIEQGGVELIRITDDGCGIPESELHLAIAPHATSKVARPEDLDQIATMGFRGEAIASIASVSRMSMRSRTSEQAAAAVIEVEGDLVRPVGPAAGPVGTCVTVRNIFFNTPARRKFLRTPATEQGHCVDVASSLAMAHPHVAFKIMVDGRTVLELPASQGPRERALAVLGQELEGQFVEVSADRFDDARGVLLWGMAGLPSIARATPKAQHVFLNGRPIRDKTVQHALREAYRGLMEPGRYPTCVLMLEMSPSGVDVNVHPAKTEVRFRDQSMVHSVVLRAVRDALRAADLTPVFGQTSGSDTRAAEAGLPSAITESKGFVDFFRRTIPESVGTHATVRFEYQAVRDAIERVTGLAADVGGEPATAPESDAPASPDIAQEPITSLPMPQARDRLLQVHNSYVVTQDQQGLLIVDQHALHERIMFEALKARITGESGSEATVAKPLESQQLLVPVVVHVSRGAAARLDELQGLFQQIGVSARLLSPEAVGIEAFPSFLFERGVDAHDFMKEILDKAEAEGFTPGSEQALHEVLDMMACKAAVKAGDRMTDLELLDLLKLRELVERSASCPHGRPTSVRLSIRELEKLFGRV